MISWQKIMVSPYIKLEISSTLGFMVDYTRFDHFPKEKTIGKLFFFNNLQGTNICLFYFAWTLIIQNWCFPTHINSYLQNSYFFYLEVINRWE